MLGHNETFVRFLKRIQFLFVVILQKASLITNRQFQFRVVPRKIHPSNDHGSEDASSNMQLVLVTCPVCHADKLPVKEYALRNMPIIAVTCSVCHADKSPVKEDAPRNMLARLVVSFKSKASFELHLKFSHPAK